MEMYKGTKKVEHTLDTILLNSTNYLITFELFLIKEKH